MRTEPAAVNRRRGTPRLCGTATDAERWRGFVGAINAPFHSYRFDPPTC